MRIDRYVHRWKEARKKDMREALQMSISDMRDDIANAIPHNYESKYRHVVLNEDALNKTFHYVTEDTGKAITAKIYSDHFRANKGILKLWLTGYRASYIPSSPVFIQKPHMDIGDISESGQIVTMGKYGDIGIYSMKIGTARRDPVIQNVIDRYTDNHMYLENYMKRARSM